jgi:signal transduction histidine kinase
VELYGADRALVSRFALNLPEYLYRASQRRWPGTSCEWESFGEVTRFGAADRSVIHAERGLCDPNGQLIGAIVVHIAPNDYGALPFLTSANPYYEMLGMASAPAADSRVAGLQVVVYGWSFQPIFASGHVAWAIPESLFLRLYQSGAPFWTSLSADGRTYHVYFSENRAGIYALGYTTPTALEHAERLGEIAALTGLFFVLVQIVLTSQAAIVRRQGGHLRALFNEVRTSFYRKLFLAFVLVAVLPVLLFAFAFTTYMTAKFRADVVSEAGSVVSVAHRVLDELAAAGQRPDTPLTPLSDDMMVWIRQVVDQDVNVFNGPDLVATSQRDLLDSGLLPTRTPAAVYRAVALDQLPTFATEDRLGDSRYLVAAAPVNALGRDAVLSVPLASRQVEIDREDDDLDRGVLVGSVLVVLFAAGLGASVARRVSDPVARLTRATRQIAAGRLDVRIAASTADELRRLVDDFNTMTRTLRTQRDELARTNQIKAWNEMARQVAHEIKNPLTPIQLSAEHLQRVHEDQGRPLGAVFDQCLRTILGQVRLLRQIASEFSNFAAESTPRPESVALAPLLESIVGPYRLGLGTRIAFSIDTPADLPPVWADRTFLSRALTNLVENAVQAVPGSGSVDLSASSAASIVTLVIADTGVGMDETALLRAFEPYFSTKTGGSGLGLANAKRNIERQNGSIAIASRPGEGTTLTITLPSAASRPDGTAAG